jgi:hypothetical protein
VSSVRKKIQKDFLSDSGIFFSGQKFLQKNCALASKFFSAVQLCTPNTIFTQSAQLHSQPNFSAEGKIALQMFLLLGGQFFLR